MQKRCISYYDHHREICWISNIYFINPVTYTIIPVCSHATAHGHQDCIIPHKTKDCVEWFSCHCERYCDTVCDIKLCWLKKNEWHPIPEDLMNFFMWPQILIYSLVGHSWRRIEAIMMALPRPELCEVGKDEGGLQESF